MTPNNENTISESRKRELAARFNEPEDNYELLREGVQKQRKTASSAEQLDTDGILQQYLKFTDKMIGVADGSIEERDITDPRNPEVSSQKPDVMIFLDKSARPVADLMEGLWEQFASEGVDMPKFDFLNIDRVNWFVKQGYSRVDAETILGPRDFDINKVSDEDVASIRALFVKGDLTEENWQSEVASMPTILDGKNVVMVDEVKSQGGTLSIATQLLRRAIPEAIVSGQYFWETTYRQMADGRMADSVPVWYSKVSNMGRGVGDVSKSYYETRYEQEPSQENLRRMIGWAALSAPHHEMDINTGEIKYIDDRLYAKLKQDIAYLSYAAGDNRVIRNPDSDRSDENRQSILNKQDITQQEATLWRANSKAIKHRIEHSPDSRAA